MNIEIAPMAAEHADGFHSAFDQVAREGKYLARLKAPPIESTRAWIADNVAKGHPQFVALDGGTVVGWCDAVPNVWETQLHCATLGMGLLDTYRGKGIGRRLLTTTLARARAMELTRIELTVAEDNAAAIHLYERHGFVREGVLRNKSRVEGRYRNVILMALVDAEVDDVHPTTGTKA